MNFVLPYTTNPAQMSACERLRLLNPRAVGATGPNVAARERRPVCGGVLHGWEAAAARALLAPPDPVETWDLSWTDEEADWEARVGQCSCPEEVEALLPARWIGYRVQGDVDGALARVCRLCTALVQRFVALSSGNNANASTAKWRQRQALYDRLGAVMELLEASIGSAIPILKLQDTEFIRQCWEQLQDEEKMEVMSALGAPDDEITKRVIEFSESTTAEQLVKEQNSMLQKTSIRLLSFAQLLCGEDTAKLIHNEEQCQRAIATFRELSPNAPLPLPVATAYTTFCIKGKRYRDAVSTISCYPQPEKLILNLKEHFHEHKGEFSAEDIKETLVLLRDAHAPGVVIFLNILANHCISDSSCPESFRREVRQMVLSHIRFVPHSAPMLLKSLCVLSSPSATDCGDIMSVVKIAMQGGFIDPTDFSMILDILLEYKDYNRIAVQWRWMRHTSARWNQRAVSAAICAFVQLEQIDEAIACIQCLAEANLDPTIDAQCTFIFFLSNHIPPMPHYAEQLMRHWHPEQDTLWTGPSQRVGINCIFTFFRAKMHQEVIRLLDEASSCVQGTPEAAESFLKHKGMHILMNRYASEVSRRPPMEALFFDSVRRMPDLADYPLVMAAFLIIGVRQGRLSDAYEAIARARSISNDGFDQFVRYLVNSLQQNQLYGVLHIFREVARLTQKNLSPDIEAWIELFDAH